MSDINEALGVGMNADVDQTTSSKVIPSTGSEGIHPVGTSAWKNAGVFLFVTLGMVYFTLIAPRLAAASTTCPIGFIVSTFAFDKSLKEMRWACTVLSFIEILFYLIFGGYCQYQIEHAASRAFGW